MHSTFLLLLVFLTATSLSAQDKLSEVDKIFSWTNPSMPGCACAVAKDGKLVVEKAYGSADLERNVPLTVNSVFDIASLQKQFVAASVLMLVEEKKLALSDDIRKYIPELPDYGHKITIDHLLTHTSGLRDWTGILPLAGGDPDAFTIILRQKHLNFIPGEEWAYSNSGYVLLKELITRISAMSVNEFMRKRIFEPLQMHSSQYLSDLRTIVKNRALAFEKQGSEWKLDMKLDNDRGGGGAMMSTAGDLIKWNEALTKGTLGNWVTSKLQEAAKLNNGRKLGYARALFLDENPGGNVIWHTGGSSGYGSVLVRFPEHTLSIAIVCNSGDAGNRMVMTESLYSLFVPAKESENKDEKKIPEEQSNFVGLDKKAGLFFNESTGMHMRILVNKGRIRIANGPILEILDENRFRNSGGQLSFMSGDAFTINFTSANRFELKSMEGKITSWKRAEAWTPSISEMKEFTGSFYNDEVMGSLNFSVGEKGLYGRVNESNDKRVLLQPVAKDVFQIGGMMIRFIRDQNGNVVSLNYSNPLVRKLEYEKK